MTKYDKYEDNGNNILREEGTIKTPTRNLSYHSLKHIGTIYSEDEYEYECAEFDGNLTCQQDENDDDGAEEEVLFVNDDSTYVSDEKVMYTNINGESSTASENDNYYGDDETVEDEIKGDDGIGSIVTACTNSTTPNATRVATATSLNDNTNNINKNETRLLDGDTGLTTASDSDSGEQRNERFSTLWHTYLDVVVSNDVSTTNTAPTEAKMLQIVVAKDIEEPNYVIAPETKTSASPINLSTTTNRIMNCPDSANASTQDKTVIIHESTPPPAAVTLPTSYNYGYKNDIPDIVSTSRKQQDSTIASLSFDNGSIHFSKSTSSHSTSTRHVIYVNDEKVDNDGNDGVMKDDSQEHDVGYELAYDIFDTDVAVKRQQIEKACTEGDLWALRQLAVTTGGLLASDLRQRSWSLLAALDHLSTAASSSRSNSPNRTTATTLASSTESVSASSSSHSSQLVQPDIVSYIMSTAATPTALSKNNTYDDDDNVTDCVESLISFHTSLSLEDRLLLQQDLRNNSNYSYDNGTRTTIKWTAVEKFVLFHTLSNFLLKKEKQQSLSNCITSAITSKQYIQQPKQTMTPSVTFEHAPSIALEKKFHYYPGLVNLTSVLAYNLELNNNSLSKVNTDGNESSSTLLMLQRLSECHLRDALRVSSNMFYNTSSQNDRDYDKKTTTSNTTTTTPTPKPILDRIVDTATTRKKNTKVLNDLNNLHDDGYCARELFVSPAESSLGFASVQSPSVDYLTSTSKQLTRTRNRKECQTPQISDNVASGLRNLPKSVTKIGNFNEETYKTVNSSTSSRVGCDMSVPSIVRNDTASTSASTSTFPSNLASTTDKSNEVHSTVCTNETATDRTIESPLTTSTLLSDNPTGSSSASTSLCRLFLRNASPIEKGCVLTFLSLLQMVDMDVYESLIQLCETYFPNDTDVIINGLQTVATVVSYYVSTWFVTSYQLNNEADAEKDQMRSANGTSIDGRNWTKHSRQVNYHLSSRMVDFFLVSHPLMPVYFATAMFVINTEEQGHKEAITQCKHDVHNDNACTSLGLNLHQLFQYSGKLHPDKDSSCLKHISQSQEEAIALSMSYIQRFSPKVLVEEATTIALLTASESRDHTSLPRTVEMDIEQESSSSLRECTDQHNQVAFLQDMDIPDWMIESWNVPLFEEFSTSANPSFIQNVKSASKRAIWNTDRDTATKIEMYALTVAASSVSSNEVQLQNSYVDENNHVAPVARHEDLTDDLHCSQAIKSSKRSRRIFVGRIVLLAASCLLILLGTRKIIVENFEGARVGTLLISESLPLNMTTKPVKINDIGLAPQEGKNSLVEEESTRNFNVKRHNFSSSSSLQSTTFISNRIDDISINDVTSDAMPKGKGAKSIRFVKNSNLSSTMPIVTQHVPRMVNQTDELFAIETTKLLPITFREEIFITVTNEIVTESKNSRIFDEQESFDLSDKEMVEVIDASAWMVTLTTADMKSCANLKKQGHRSFYAMLDQQPLTWANGSLKSALTKDTGGIAMEGKNFKPNFMHHIVTKIIRIQEKVRRQIDGGILMFQSKSNERDSAIGISLHNGLNHWRHLIKILGKKHFFQLSLVALLNGIFFVIFNTSGIILM